MVTKGENGSPDHWMIRNGSVSLDRPVIMGIVNVTPDSFSDGGRFADADRAVAHGLDLVGHGADIVDVGGESTRPGSDPVSEEEELRRVIEVVSRLSSVGVVVSIDTRRVTVAGAALAAGAKIVNDVTGLEDPRMRNLVAKAGAGAVIMHMKGVPSTMQDDPTYDDVVTEVRDYLVERSRLCEAEGIDRRQIVIDPGIGFGKTGEHNLQLIDRLDFFAASGYPVAVGPSRKRFLGTLTGLDRPDERDGVTAVVVALAAERGARIFRVHEPAAAGHAATIAHAMVRTRR